MFLTRVCILIVGLLVGEPRTLVSGEPLTIVRGSATGKKTPVDLWAEPLAVGALARMHASSFREVRQILGAALSADGTIVALATNQNQLLLFDARTAKLIKRINVEPFGSPSLAFTPDGAKLAWINQGGALILRDISQDKEGSRLAVAKRRIARFSFSANGKAVAAVAEAIGKEPGVYVWDCDTGKEKGQVAVLQNWQVHVAISADGDTLVTWGQQVRPGERARNQQLSQTIQIQSLATHQEIGRFLVDAGPVAAAALSPDKQLFAAAAAVSTIHLWQIARAKELHRITGFADRGARRSLSPDGKSILAATAGGALLTFATDTGKNLYRCEGPGCPVTSVSIRDGAALALGMATKRTRAPLEQQTPYLWQAVGRDHNSWQRSFRFHTRSGCLSRRHDSGIGRRRWQSICLGNEFREKSPPGRSG